MTIPEFRLNFYKHKNKIFKIFIDFNINEKFNHGVTSKKFPFHKTLLNFLHETESESIYLTDKPLEESTFKKNDDGTFLVNIDEFKRFCEKLDKREDRANAFFRQEVNLDNINFTKKQKSNILANTDENDLFEIFSKLTNEKRNLFLNLLKNIPDLNLPKKENYSDEELLELVKNKDLSFLMQIITKNEILDFLNQESGLGIVKEFLEKNTTKEDIVNIGYRKEQLELFNKMLNEDGFFEQYKKDIGKETSKDEIIWQDYFEKNSWIFGYGLDYRYLGILQKEAHISDVELNGTNEVICDFLMGCSNFTTLIEIKKPNTPIFDETNSGQNRSKSWKLSKDLIHGFSQILEQKSSWQIKSEGINYDNNGKRISQITIDPKTFLIFGRIDNLKDTFEDQIKKRTFELFRRDSRNIEILTYDELYKRASFIVNGN